ncbi:autotransporter outer membrane beta-barrel domain-containing protein [Pollutimonas sp. M17]|uniref:autotransporter outer membrane beta-barrel domain-containing protein n=1 Tax=Pollutimonas sp. M17 TaxID=2962065 RepID=UPI0021F46DF0|nr:autotransporter outer membrane beta-barrel domain-containing protein [Pollutimonas sp. M17]UYO95202.1 autotransporter outer membrane beta-barrel domain-containing protein [Pollutimonas sp. M17]
MMGIRHVRSNRGAFRIAALSTALLGVYGTAYSADPTVTVTGTQDIGAGPYSGVIVNGGGVATGTGTTVAGGLYELNQVKAGGSLTLTNASITNTITPNQNGRAVSVSGAGAAATLTDSTIVLNAFNGHSGGHAFTAGVGAENGGHAVIDGGTITASGSKRTVGIQANDGGSIDASNVAISTHSTFGHAVNAYRTPTSSETATLVKLNNVTINTYDLNYADGIQSANKGARVEAINTDITTIGTNSFGAEVFNGATASFTGGSITTSGATAAGVRVYGGSLGSGSVSITGTHINTGGVGAVGVVAADIAEQTAGTISLANTNIETHGANAAAVQASYGSQITSGGGNTFHTYGSKSTGVAATTGGGVSLGSDTVTAELGNGISADGAGSTITTSGTTISTNGGKYGAYATNGGSITLAGGSVTNASTASGAMGIAAAGDGSAIIGTNVALSAKGEYTGPGELSNVVSVSNNANINLTGGSISSLSSQFGRGILAGTNGTVTTTGVAISTIGNLSNAVHAYSNQKTAAATSDAASIQINGGSITTSGQDAYGLSAQNINAAIATNATGSASTTITTTGENAYGAVAYNGAALNLRNTQISTFGAGALGIAINKMSAAQVPGSVPTPNVASTLIMSGGGVTTSGNDAHGVALASGSTATLDQTSIAVTGVNAFGVRLEGGSTASLTGGAISSIGDDFGGGLYSTGAGSKITATDVVVAVQRRRVDSANKPIGVGVEAVRGGRVELTRGSVTTLRDWNDGLLAYRGSITTNGTAIQTNGLASTGVKSWREVSAYPGEVATTTMTGGSVTTLGNESYGLLAQNAGSTITATNTTVTTSGSQSYGANAYNGGALVLSSVAVKTSGANAHGLVMGGMSDTMRPGSDGHVPTVASSIDMTGGSIVATGSGSSGVYLEDSGSITLNGVRVESNAASITSQLTQSGQIQDIVIGSGSALKVNNGNLLQVNRSTAGMDGIVNLTLKAGSTSVGNIVDLDGLSSDGTGLRDAVTGGKTNFTVETGASWTGVIKGINDAGVGDGGSFVDNGGGAIAGNVSGGSNSVVTFNSGANISGGVEVGSGSRASFNGTTVIQQNVVNNGGSMSFTGPATINQNVAGTGANYSFSGGANIAQSVSGVGSTFSFSGATTIGQMGTPATLTGSSNSSFSFSRTAPTIINGSVDLSGGSSTHGGTIGTPVEITGDAAVSSGAVLGGNLRVTGALSGTGGILGPGNSVGAQSFGSVSGFGGTYLAEVNAAGQSDLITLTSLVDNSDLRGIALKVGQENGNGGYVFNHDYTILETVKSDGISAITDNTFSSAALDNSFAGSLVTLDPVKYGPNYVRISLSKNAGALDAERATWSGNQRSVMSGLDGNPLDFTVAAMQADQRKDALNQLSGEVHGSTQSALHSAGGLLISTVGNRMRGNVGAGMLAGAPMADASGTIPAGAMPRSAAYPLWAEVVGNWNTLDGGDNASKTKSHTAGIYVGGDVAVGAGWRVGGALGFTDGRIKADDVGSRSDVRSYTATVYGGNSWAAGNGQVNFLAGAGYTRHNIESRRTINVGGSQTLKADYHANTTQLFTELGYAIPVGQASTIEPYAGLAWSSQRSQGFSESGGSAALRSQGQTDNVTTLTLGLRGKTLVELGGREARLSAGLGWRHASGDVASARTMSFIQGNGAAFTVAGSPIAKNAAVVDLGAEMSVGRNAAMGLGYSGQFGQGSTDSTGSLYLKVRF